MLLLQLALSLTLPHRFFLAAKITIVSFIKYLVVVFGVDDVEYPRQLIPYLVIFESISLLFLLACRKPIRNAVIAELTKT
jgi:hypothetical protein